MGDLHCPSSCCHPPMHTRVPGELGEPMWGSSVPSFPKGTNLSLTWKESGCNPFVLPTSIQKKSYVVLRKSTRFRIKRTECKSWLWEFKQLHWPPWGTSSAGQWGNISLSTQDHCETWIRHVTVVHKPKSLSRQEVPRCTAHPTCYKLLGNAEHLSHSPPSPCKYELQEHLKDIHLKSKHILRRSQWAVKN